MLVKEVSKVKEMKMKMKISSSLELMLHVSFLKFPVNSLLCATKGKPKKKTNT